MNRPGPVLGLSRTTGLGYTPGMIAAEDIERVAARIGEAADAERVILFGSHARGDAGEHSDVDLMIIAQSDQPRFKRSRELHKMFRPYPFGMDLLVYTPEEIEAGKQCEASFVSRVLREGRAVYVRRDWDREAVAGQSPK